MRKLLLLLALAASPVFAENISGNEVLDMHRKTEPTRSMGAFWYMRGVLDADEKYRLLYAMTGSHLKGGGLEKVLSPAFFCLPEGAQYGQIYDVYIRHLAKEPATRHLAADYLLGVALRDAWPCPSGAAK
jgi:hypothetical protein